MVRSNLDDLLLKWPEEKFSNPEWFFNGSTPDFEDWDRPKTWFADKSFTVYRTPYTFSDQWTKLPLKAVFIVPNDLEPGLKVPIMWYFHGGGLRTGAADHDPFFSDTTVDVAKEKDAIIISLEYPEAPEATYKDIITAIREFVSWYKYDGYFKTELSETHSDWKTWLKKRIGKDIYINKNRIYVEGESTGAHVVVMAMWLNADITLGSNLNMNAALLRFPLIKHHERKRPDTEPMPP
jgi:hypothetical protein